MGVQVIAIPVSNDGASVRTVTTEAGTFQFYTRWMPLDSAWLCDIFDAQGRAVCSGISLVAGAVNLVGGTGNAALDGYALQVGTLEGDERALGAWGKTALLMLFSPGEARYFTPTDPMLAPVPMGGDA